MVSSALNYTIFYDNQNKKPLNFFQNISKENNFIQMIYNTH
jgi:hypothetical protein